MRNLISSAIGADRVLLTVIISLLSDLVDRYVDVLLLFFICLQKFYFYIILITYFFSYLLISSYISKNEGVTFSRYFLVPVSRCLPLSQSLGPKLYSLLPPLPLSPAPKGQAIVTRISIPLSNSTKSALCTPLRDSNVGWNFILTFCCFLHVIVLWFPVHVVDYGGVVKEKNVVYLLG